MKSSIIILLTYLFLLNPCPVLSDNMQQIELRLKAYKIMQETGLRRIRAPYRAHNKVRYENISDIEIREIISSYEEHEKKKIDNSLISIGTVTEGCDCELEGCKNQVFLSFKSEYILFIKIENTWKISPVYIWWEKYNTLYNELSQTNNSTKETQLLTKINSLIDSAPKCNS